MRARRRPRPDAEYELAPGYEAAYQILQGMVNDRLVAKHKSGMKGAHDLYSLHHNRRGPSRMNYQHEICCAELYVAYRLSGKLAGWSAGWTPDLYRRVGRGSGLNPDAILELEGSNQTVFFEVDMGTESYDTLDSKVQRYLQLDGRIRPFVVVFTFQDNADRNCTWSQRTGFFLDNIAERHGRGKQFSGACHYALVNEPLEPAIFTYSGTEKLSIVDLAR